MTTRHTLPPSRTSPSRLKPRLALRPLFIPCPYRLEPLETFELFSAIPFVAIPPAPAGASQNTNAASTASLVGAAPPPTAPNNVHATGTSSSQINITWSDNASDETGYEIQASSLNWGAWTTVGTVGANVTTFTQTNLAPGASFEYRVRAIGADADSDWSNDNPAFAATLVSHDPTKAIHAAGYQDSSGSFYNYQDGVSMWDNGSWFKYSSLNFSNNSITSFSAVSCGPTAGDSFDIHLDSPTGTLLGTLAIPATADWNTFENATTALASATGVHDVYIVFHSTGGSNNVRTFSFGANHAPVNTIPAAQVLNENSSLIFSALNSNLITTTDSDDDGNPLKVTLSVSNGTLTLGHTDNLTFLTGDGASDSTMIFTGTLSSLQYALSSVQYTPNANFTGADLLTFTTDDQGFTGSGGAQSDTDTVALNVTSAYVPPPAAPTSPFANAAASGVTLTWTDNSNVEQSFEIQRSSGGYTNDWATIGTVAANVTSFVDATAAAGTAYKYRVRAVNSSGASAFTGDWDAVVTTPYLHDLQTPWRLPNYEQTNNTGSNWGTGMSVGGDGTWFRYSNFDFSSATVTALTIVSAGPVSGNQIEVRLDSPTGPQIGLVTLTGGGDYSTLVSSTGAISAITGIHDVYLVYREPFGWGNLLYNASFGPNLPPVNTVPSTQLLLVNTPLTLSGPNGNRISIADPDNLDTRMRVTLSASNGTVSLSTLNGLSIISGTGANDGTITVEGYPADLNTALNGLTFTPTADFTGAASLTITTNDLGFTGNGGPQTDTDTVALHVLDSLNPPADLSSFHAVATSASAISLAWIDSSNDSTGFEIQRAAWGTSDWTTIATASPTDSSYTDSALATGASFQYRIRAISDTGFSNWTVPAVATVRTTHSVTATYSADLYQDSSNVDATFPGGISSIADGGWILFSNFDFSANPTTAFTVTAATPTTTDAGFLTIHLDSPTGTQIGCIAITHSTTPNAIQAITDTIAAVTGIHDVYLVFEQANGIVPSFYNFTFATNQPPVNTVPPAQTIPEGRVLTFSPGNGNQFTVSDPDAGSAMIQVTLTATHGTLTLGQTSNLTFLAGDGASDQTMTFRGTTWDITTALAGMTFTSDLRFVGDASLEILTDDLGNTGAGGPQQADSSVLIHVVAALTPPNVAVPAASTPVASDTFALSVMGTDADGEQVLTYHWTTLRAPAGAQIAFSANDTNSAKATNVSVDRAGNYTFQVTISDGESVTTSSVSVAVKPPPVSNPPSGPVAPPTDGPSPAGPHGPDPTPGPPTFSDPPPTHPGGPGPGKPVPNAPPPMNAAVSGHSGSSDAASSSGDSSGTARSTSASAAASAASNSPVTSAAPTPSATAAPTSGAAAFHAEPAIPGPAAPITAADLARIPAAAPAGNSLKLTELINDTVDASPVPSAVAPAVAQELEKSEEQLQASQRNVQRVFGTIVGVSATATSVCILWIARGGSLLLSMLTSVPMWRYLDPLPVLDTTPVAKRRRKWHWPWRAALKVAPDTTDQPIEELIG